ncbi:hypothetical protein FQN57_007223 [Myotisia sp. PD_48]|nr:hypothetical protein FQN57_007223 [Myotisia sp. PD_48]
MTTTAEDRPRKRGRPPKPGGPAAPKPVNLDESGQPRKRGRPRKNPLSPGSIKTQVPPKDTDAPKKPRGRPPKTDSAPGAPGAAAPAKQRGRPKKSATNGGPASTSSSDIPALLKKFVGSYAIDYPEVLDQWPQNADGMQMTVSVAKDNPEILVAGFDLGIVEGTMILSPSAAALHAYQVKLERRRPIPFNSEEDAEEEETGPPAKKPKSAKTEANTSVGPYPPLLIRWRGRETGEGEIVSGTHQNKAAMIEFLDEKGIQFKGIIDLPYVRNGEFSGTKFDTDIPNPPEPWSNFLEQAYEYERGRRWR